MIDHITMLRAQEAGLPAAESHPDPPLVCFPLRLDWEKTQPVVPEDHTRPEPEVIGQVTTDYHGKGAVAGLIDRVAAFGWRAVVTVARGCWPSVAGRPSGQRTSLAVRLYRGRERAVAIYVEGLGESSSWGWMDLYRWSDGTFPHLDASITQFIDALLGPAALRPSLAEAKLGPILGPEVEPRGYVYGPVAPPGSRKRSGVTVVPS